MKKTIDIYCKILVRYGIWLIAIKLVIKNAQVVLKKNCFYSLHSFRPKEGKKAIYSLFKWCIYCDIIGDFLLWGVASNLVSGQLLPFHLVQNDLAEWATILCRVKYSNLAFKMLLIYCTLFYFDEMSIVYHSPGKNMWFYQNMHFHIYFHIKKNIISFFEK